MENLQTGSSECSFRGSLREILPGVMPSPVPGPVPGKCVPWRRRFSFLLLLVTTLVALIGSQSAHANRATFGSASFPSIDGPGTCGVCHTNAAVDWDDNSLVLSGPSSISSSQTSVNISVSGLSASHTSFLWRYRVGSSGAISYPATSTSSANVSVGSSGNPTIHFCIAESIGADIGDPRNLNCGNLTIPRDPPPNNAPTITSVAPSGPVALVAGTSQSVTVTATDDGPSNQLDHSASSNNNSVATVSGGGSGSSETFTINAVSAGTATITFRVRDRNSGSGNKSDTETVTVNVSAPPNGAPSITMVSPSGPISLVAGGTQGVTVTATDDGPVSQLDHTASSNNNSVATVSGGGGGASETYTITAVSAGSATITFRVRDRNSGSGNKTDTETVTVNVSAPPNEAPSITSVSPSGPISLVAGGTQGVTVTATDDGPVSQLDHTASSNNNSVATVSGGGGGATETFTITAVSAGSATITFRVRDRNSGSGNKSDTETVTINVSAPPNGAPAITSVSPSSPLSLVAGNSQSVTVTATDDGPVNQLDHTASSDNSSVATVSGGGGGASETFTITAVGAGSAIITFRVRDRNSGSGNKSDTESVTVNVSAPPNGAPTITSINPGGSVALIPGGSSSVSVTANDDGPASELVHSAQSSNTAVATVSGGGSGGTQSFTITATGTGDATITFTVGDENGGSGSEQVSQVVNVTVATVNQPPQISSVIPSGAANVTVGASLSVTVNANDDATDPLNYSASSSNPSVATVNNTGGGSFMVQGQSEGSATITLTVTDDQGESDSDSLSITVNAVTVVNQPPQISNVSPSGAANVTVGDSLSVTVNANDDTTDPLNYSASSTNPSVATVSNTGGGSFDVQGQSEGSATINLTVTDNEGESDSESLTITVNPVVAVNQPPVINSVSSGNSLSLTAGNSQSISLNVSDESTSTLTYAGNSSNATVVTVSNDGNGSFTVSAQSAGDAQLTLTVTDEAGLSASQVVAVTVAAGNSAPIANDDQLVYGYQSTGELIDVIANDTDAESDPLTVVLSSDFSALGGSLTLQTNLITYVAPENLASEDSFTYSVTDSNQASSNTATVTIIPSDGDGDGFFDNADNCRILANPDQVNADGDELGDACDPDPDGDGEIGEATRPFTTGKFLVEGVCLDCHREGVSGAPQFGDEEAWAARVEAAGGIEPLLNSVTFGKGAMPAWGRVYTARELIQGLLYMTGLEDDSLPPGPESLFDFDADGVDNLNDNCKNFFNLDQADVDGNGVGDVCEPDQNGDGVLDYSLSLLVAQQTESGSTRGAIVTTTGEVTVSALTRSGLEGLSYDWSESSAASLGLFTSGTNTESVKLDPATAGVYDLVVRVSGNGISALGRTRLVVLAGAAGIDLTDTDGDGYPAHLDDNNLSANRVIADSSQSTQSSVLFSDDSISLGELAMYTATSNNYQSASAVLSESELLAAAQARFPGVTPVTDDILDFSIGVFDIELRELDAAETTVVLKLRGSVPVSGELKLYKPAGGVWETFSVAGDDSIASAPETDVGCPASTSGDFSSGLNAGQSCVRLIFSDGGVNDSDGERDGVVSLVGAFGKARSNAGTGEQGPEELELNPEKGGGGSLSSVELSIVFLLWFLVLVMSKQNQGRHRNSAVFSSGVSIRYFFRSVVCSGGFLGRCK